MSYLFIFFVDVSAENHFDISLADEGGMSFVIALALNSLNSFYLIKIICLSPKRFLIICQWKSVWSPVSFIECIDHSAKEMS